MKQKSIRGNFEWNTNSNALYFITPFLSICNILRQGKTPVKDAYCNAYDLTSDEFDALLGKAEREVHQYKG